MSAGDTSLKVELATKIIEIAENYSSWPNLNASKDEFAEEVLDLLFNYGLDIDG